MDFNLRGKMSVAHDMLESRWAVCITGSRASTAYGETVTQDLVGQLDPRQDMLVCGSSYGIEATAIRAALRRDLPVLVLMPGGVDRPYPLGNAQLFEDVVLSSAGALVSHFPDGTAPTRASFLERARMLADMASLVVVVEAGFRSTVHATVDRALLLDKPVYAVPGPVTSAASAGTNDLIRKGSARLLTSMLDILE